MARRLPPGTGSSLCLARSRACSAPKTRKSRPIRTLLYVRCPATEFVPSNSSPGRRSMSEYRTIRTLPALAGGRNIRAANSERCTDKNREREFRTSFRHGRSAASGSARSDSPSRIVPIACHQFMPPAMSPREHVRRYADAHRHPQRQSSCRFPKSDVPVGRAQDPRCTGCGRIPISCLASGHLSGVRSGRALSRNRKAHIEQPQKLIDIRSRNV